MVRQGVDMKKHLYVVVASVKTSAGIWEAQSMEIEASGRVDAKFKFHAETGIGEEHITYILTVYGPYERIDDGPQI